MNKKTCNTINSNDNINAFNEYDTFSFIEGENPIIPPGKCIAEFNFEDNYTSIDMIKSSSKLTDSLSKLEAFNSNFNKTLIPACHGSIPSINDEIPDVKRCYVLRSSTVRKINEIKNNHSSLNVCVSTIVDLAVDYYYDYSLNSHNNIL